MKSVISSVKRGFSTRLPVGESYEGVPKASSVGPSAGVSKVTELKNGVRVATIQQAVPGTGVSVGVFVRSGTRNETTESFGASAFLKRMAFQSTNTRTSLRLCREIEHLGGTYRVATGREHTLYASEVTPDKLPEIIPILSDVLNPALLDWEVRDEVPILENETKILQQDARAVLFELLHQEAFRNKGLGNSLYPPIYNIHNIDSDLLLRYLATQYTADRVTLVAAGNVDHDQFVKIAEEKFAFLQKSQDNSPGAHLVSSVSSQYVGGDARIAADADTHVAIGFEGLKVGDKDAHALSTLQALLSGGVAVEDSIGSGATSNIFRAVTSDKWLKEVSSFNVNYSDSGLFGLIGVAKAGHGGQLVQGITSAVRKAVSQLDEGALAAAKRRSRADLYFGHDTRPALLEFAGYQALFQGKVESVETFAQGVEAVTIEDVKRVAQKTFSKRPTLAAVGDIQDLPTTEAIQKALAL
eukprot:TRINITY_DN535_c0_g1_i1.p1 TRINITY_DN535_c0_g1~~TRINITY_DN535_c0_g1_i1.p1  ORF type:complete len:470 (-),score=123.19 TRINITY_DN535_c0_g1_i1:86-1495(-)